MRLQHRPAEALARVSVPEAPVLTTSPIRRQKREIVGPLSAAGALSTRGTQSPVGQWRSSTRDSASVRRFSGILARDNGRLPGMVEQLSHLAL